VAEELKKIENEEVETVETSGSKVKWVVMAAILIVALIGGSLMWSYYSVRESTDDAQIDGHITPISARVGGTVTSINFADNQLVKAGDLLATLDGKDYQVAVDKAAADLKDSQSNASAATTNIPISSATTSAQLAGAEAQLAAAQRDVESAHARIREAEANHTKAAQDLQRMKALVEKDEISRQQYDAAVAAESSTRASLSAMQSAVASAESRVNFARANVRSAQTAPQQVSITRDRAGSASAQIARYQSLLEQTQLNLGYTQIKAPVNGIIGKRSAEPGQVISAGQPIASLVDLDSLYVTANFKEDQLRHMRPGQQVDIKVDAYGLTLKGHVDSIGGATGARFSLLPPENATGNYVKVVQRVPVKIVIEPGQDPNHLLRPGLSVAPVVHTGR